MIHRIFAADAARFVRDAEGSAGGGNAPAAAPEPATFSTDYVRELRAENKGYRLKASEFEQKLKAAEAAVAQHVAAAEAAAKSHAEALQKRVSELQDGFHQRLIDAELKAGSIAAGLAHPDFLTLIDKSAVSVDADGAVQVPTDFWSGVKASLPHLFTATGADKGTTSNPAAAPKPAPSTVKHVSEMSAEEYAAAEAALLKQR
ncbi:phage scaffolding protein [Endobacter medicaginis]|nr:hypothetical protein [Endobacter medicaginis]MCX5476729.1 hypothetical protein [Endobacter medicaginis]